MGKVLKHIAVLRRMALRDWNVFLSHAWDTDGRERSTHERVRALHRELTRLGWSVWFDEAHLLLGTDVDAEMARGVAQSDVVCICVTRGYAKRVAQVHTGVWREWNCAHGLGKVILPLIFDPAMLDASAWSPLLQMYLRRTMWMDATGDDVAEIASRLSHALHLIGLHPRTHSPRPRTALLEPAPAFSPLASPTSPPKLSFSKSLRSCRFWRKSPARAFAVRV